MLTTGQKLGAIEILGPLGAGGMGEVYRARDTKLGRQVAIKVLPSDVAGDPARLARFENEARAASALNHLNIVTIHEIGRENDIVFLVMEHVEGKTLRELMAENRIPLRRALQIAGQTAAGLAKAHAAGIVHRDIKPENLMVSADGMVKILDFGLAKGSPGPSGTDSRVLTMAAAETSPGMVVGTADYMSPGQARGAPVDMRSDQFSLGAVLYEMFAGSRPFQSGSVPQTLSAIIEKDPEPLGRRNPDVPAPVLWMLERCLSKEPADRYASTLDLARDLQSVSERLSEISSGPVVARPAPGPALSAGRGSRLLWAALGLAAGVALAAAGARWLVPRGATEPPPIRIVIFSGEDIQPSASPDGRRVTVAVASGFRTIMSAENLPNLLPPSR